MSFHILETDRLFIRRLRMEDLQSVHQILDLALPESEADERKTLEERRRWLQWTTLMYEEFSRHDQPPFADRAVVNKRTGDLVGTVGYTAHLAPFGLLPYFQARQTAKAGEAAPPNDFKTAEFGLTYAIAQAHQKKGYALEAATAMIDYAFRVLRLQRIVAAAPHRNQAALQVMKRLGMVIETNPFQEPAYLQVIGILENPLCSTESQSDSQPAGSQPA